MEGGQMANPIGPFGIGGNGSQIHRDAAGRYAPPILERFRALLRSKAENGDGEEEVRGSLSHSAEEIVSAYEAVLSELTFNSNVINRDLTILAREQKDFAEEIANAICDRTMKVPDVQKLALFHLIDNIVTEVGGEYLRSFAEQLPTVFVQTYNQLRPGMQRTMKHLFGLWDDVFPSDVLEKIDAELHLRKSKFPNNFLTDMKEPSPYGPFSTRYKDGMTDDPEPIPSCIERFEKALSLSRLNNSD